VDLHSLAPFGASNSAPTGQAALRATVGQFISLLQDTTLLSLIDPLGTARTVMANPDCLGQNAEAY
jgi:general L-amino acid transport system permease protein